MMEEDLQVAQDIQEWLTKHSALPNELSPKTPEGQTAKGIEERSLARRLRKLRSKALSDKAHLEAVQLLENCCPGWLGAKERKSQLKSAQEYASFLYQNQGRHPSRSAADEKALSIFLKNMKKNLRCLDGRTACPDAVRILVTVGALPPDSWDKYLGEPPTVRTPNPFAPCHQPALAC